MTCSKNVASLISSRHDIFLSSRIEWNQLNSHQLCLKTAFPVYVWTKGRLISAKFTKINQNSFLYRKALKGRYSDSNPENILSSKICWEFVNLKLKHPKTEYEDIRFVSSPTLSTSSRILQLTPKKLQKCSELSQSICVGTSAATATLGTRVTLRYALREQKSSLSRNNVDDIFLVPHIHGSNLL